MAGCAGVFIFAAACADPGAQPEGLTVRDSAGVEIVENRGEGTGAATEWIVSESPVLSLGTREQIPAEQFTRVGAATRLSDGTIVVLERTLAEVRFFAPDGTHLFTRGGLGQGPGEFRYARGMARGPGDSIYVHDRGTRGLTVFTPAGEFARVSIPDFAELSRQYEANTMCRDLPLFPDGTFLGCAVAPELPAQESQPETGITPRRGFRIVRLHRDPPKADRLGLWRGPLGYLLVEGGWIQGWSHAFFPTSHVAVGAGPMLLYLAHNPAYDIQVWSPDGRLQRRIRRLNARLEPTEEERTEAWDILAGSMDEPFMDEALVRRVLADFPVPDSIPAVEGLAAGPAGELWVKRGPDLPSATSSRFDVFDGAGVYLGAVTLGLPVDLLEVGSNYLLALFKDEFDVPSVLMYDLNRSDR